MANTFDTSLSAVKELDNVPRIDALKVSHSEFVDKWEKVYRPCVITNDQLEWRATSKWTLEVRFKRTEMYTQEIYWRIAAIGWDSRWCAVLVHSISSTL